MAKKREWSTVNGTLAGYSLELRLCREGVNEVSC